VKTAEKNFITKLMYIMHCFSI